MLAIPLAVFALVALGLRNPVRSLYLLFLLVVFDGAIRKWIVPSLQAEVFLAKDLLLVGLYAGAIGAGKWRCKSGEPKALAGMRIAWWSLAVLVGVDVALSRVGDSLMVVSGVRAALLYLPLTWVIPALLRDEGVFPVAEPVKALAFLSAGMAVLAMWQGSLPSDHPANAYAHGGEATQVAIMGSEGVVRATGTFSYISGLADFAQFVPAGLALAIRWRPKAAIWAVIGSGAATVMAVASGSRAAVYGVLVASLALVFAVARQKQTRGRYVFAIVATVVITIVSLARSGGSVAFLERQAGAGDAEERWLGVLLRPIYSAATLPALGYGVGSGYQQNFVREAPLLAGSRAYDEVRHSRLFLELGLVGGLIEVLIRVLQVVLVIGSARKRGNAFSGSALAILSYVVWFGWSLPTYDPVASILLSAVCGIVVLETMKSSPSERDRCRGGESVWHPV